ncbi:MAG TPA: hypothetical protein VKP65_01465 [Rhodothermales bacterium]|nr:hypothetical protein [Rhodothermales bacterium]
MPTKENDIAPRRSAILNVLREAGEALSIREIVARTDLEYNNARSALSEMTTMKLLVRVNRGIYDLPERVTQQQMEEGEHPLQKILLNQQILKVLLNIVITNKALMEALLLGQQEIISTIRTLSAGTDANEEAIKNLEDIFAQRVEWHFDIAAQQVVEQYTKLPAEVLNVLVTPLARDKDSVSNKNKEPVNKQSSNQQKVQ